MSAELVVDTECCPVGWGSRFQPCEGWGPHECKKPRGHNGQHVCRLCGSKHKAEEETPT